jgi:transposase
MPNIPQPIQNTFQQIKTQQNTRLELRKINGHYYTYQTQSKWNKQTKKTQKTAKITGTITPNGTYKPKKQKTTSPTTSTTKIYQYGNTQLCLNLTQDLQQATQNFPYKNELLALTIIRATNPTPIRLAQTTWQDTYTSTTLPANLTPKNITQTLTTLGEMIGETYDLFTQLTPKGGMLFYDLTSVLTYSKNLLLAEHGYNPEHEKKTQIKVALAFSTTTYLPVAIDVFYGSLKETKILNYFLERYKGADLGFVMDRGFKSYELLLELKQRGIHYIAALMRNSTLMPGSVVLEGAFSYGHKKRMIGFARRCETEVGFLYLFLDPKLCEVEVQGLLRRVSVGELSVGAYGLERVMAGVFGLVSDLDVEPRVVYEQYKAREEIEQAFDYMKNDLEADRTCLGCDEAVRGFFVVVFLAMRIYFKILQRLHERKLVGRVSVGEVLLLLSKMRMIVEQSGKRYLCALPKKTEDILEVFKDLITIT